MCHNLTACFEIIYYIFYNNHFDRPGKTSEKDHSFYNTVSLKKPQSFYEPNENNMLPQHSQKPLTLQMF